MTSGKTVNQIRCKAYLNCCLAMRNILETRNSVYNHLHRLATRVTRNSVYSLHLEANQYVRLCLLVKPL